MNDENRLNPNHRELRRWLRIVGPLMMVVGLVLVGIGLISFFSSFGSFEPPRYFWCAFVGLPLLGAGLPVTKFAFLGNILRYFSAESAPVGKDTFNYMASETKSGVRDIAGAVREGFAGKTISCPSCQQSNDAEARFCDNCGQPLTAEKVCQECSAINTADARYCNDCGSKFATA